MEQRETKYLDALNFVDKERYITLEEYLVDVYNYERCNVGYSSSHHRPEHYIDNLVECVKDGFVEINLCFGVAFSDMYKTLSKYEVNIPEIEKEFNKLSKNW